MNKQEKEILERLKRYLVDKFIRHEDLDSCYNIISDLLDKNYYSANQILIALTIDNKRKCEKCNTDMTILKGAHWGRFRIPAGWKCEKCRERITTVWGGASG